MAFDPQTLPRSELAPVLPPHVLSQLVENLPDAIFVADASGRYTYANPAAGRLLGCSPAELVGQSILDLIDRSDQDRLDSSRARMPTVTIDSGEWRLRRKDGTWVPVDVHANILPDGQWHAVVRDISERKAIEAERQVQFDAIDRERHWLKSVLDHLPVGILLYDREGRLSSNAPAQTLLGPLSPSSTAADYAARVLRLDGSPVPQEDLPSMRALTKGEDHVGEEFLIQQPNGTRRRVMSSTCALHDEHGRRNGAVCVIQDITSRASAEETIREKQKLLQAVFDLLPVGVWIADAGGRIVANNPAGARIWEGVRHVPLQEFGIYKGWWADSGTPIAAEEWALARALTEGRTSLGEVVRIQCFDGSIKTILNSAAPLRDESGAITGAIVVNEDITALQEAQVGLRRSEQLLRTAFDLLPVGLYITDSQGRIVRANPAGERIWQGVRYVGPEQFHEYKAWWLETGEPIRPEDWAVARAVRDGVTSRGELIRIQCFDGSFKTVVNWAAPIRDDAGQISGAIAVNDDVTALHQTQEQLRSAVRDREELLAIVSHDLRNPLGTIMMSARALEMKATLLQGAQGMAEIAASLQDTARGMSTLVDDLLAVSVEQTGRSMLKLDRVPAEALARRAAAAAKPLLDKQALRIELRLAESLPSVNVDPERIHRVFTNLLDNAAKFTTEGRILITADAVSAGVRFCVANSGEPVSAQQLQAMFQPFWQLRRDKRGAGLGLSICRSIVEAHGGTIWAEPADGERLRMCFVIPRSIDNGDRKEE